MEENTEKTNSEKQPKIYGWVAGKPAYLQEHPNNQKTEEEKE